MRLNSQQYIYAFIISTEYKVIVSWGKGKNFKAYNGKPETKLSLALGTEVKSRTGITFAITESDFKEGPNGEAPKIKAPGTYLLTVWQKGAGKPMDSMIVVFPKVELTLVNKKGITYESYKSTRCGLSGEYKNTAEVRIKGCSIDYPIMLVPSAGVKLDKPNQKYTSTTEFQFEVTKVSTAKDDLSIQAVDKNNKILAEIKFMSYLFYKLEALPCKIQHKDTNAPCEECRKAGIFLHGCNEIHPNKYEEIIKCRHCHSYCTPAVLFSLGYGKSQDDVAASAQPLEEFHERGIHPRQVAHIYKLTNLIGNGLYETTKNIYKALKNKKGILCTEMSYHSRLGWGCYTNSYKGIISEPIYYYSDPGGIVKTLRVKPPFCCFCK